MAQLVHRRDAMGRLLASLLLGLGKLFAHRIQAFGKLRQFVARAQVNRPGKISFTRSSRLFQSVVEAAAQRP